MNIECGGFRGQSQSALAGIVDHAMKPSSSSRVVSGLEEVYAMVRGRVRTLAARMGSSTKGFITVILALVVLVSYISTSWFNGAPSVFSLDQKDLDQQLRKTEAKPITLTCANETVPICPRSVSTSPSSPFPPSLNGSPSCPEYFRWIHEDLMPWRVSGITREVVESARRFATMRLVVLDGRLYVEEYQLKSMARNVFTIWGILQLLHRYPGRVPDLDLMFNCMDLPAIKAAEYVGLPSPPALFHYCNDHETLDINFPDWSFWGMSDQNVRPWEIVFKEIEEGNQVVKWIDRAPHAYWKGNRYMGNNRQDLMKCNVSKDQDWNARLYGQDWVAEAKHGFKKSGLKRQCVHRYKIYVEGISWSVSQKNILACDSPTLVVTPRYHEFFTRALMPGQHYWPIQENNKCRSIKFAVDWGNKHPEKAQAIGEAGSRFIQEQLKMEFIYDYMLHVLTQYAKLLRYKPTVPQTATEYCLESVACPTEGLVKDFLLQSRVKWTHDAEPCAMPAPYSPAEMQELVARKAEAIKQVEMWENSAWDENGNYKF